MLFIWFGVLLFGLADATRDNFTNEYVLKDQRLDVVKYNPEYFSNVWIKTRKFNRTQVISNGTYVMIKNMKKPFKMEVQAYKFMSNEYRYFPLRFSYDFCQALRMNDFGVLNLLKCGNFSLTGCPFKKGTFFICNFFVDSQRFPPLVPQGDYMLDLKWFEGETEILFLQAYGTIQYTSLWGH